MGNWRKFNETSLPEKEDFYSHLNMEEITDSDHRHTERVCKDFKIKHFDDYHDLFVQSNTLFLADMFENFQNMGLEYMNLILFLFLLHQP